jgi:hypothetical protein
MNKVAEGVERVPDACRGDGGKPPSPWNSLEVAKLLMSSLTPIVIFVVGRGSRHLRQEKTVERDQADQREGQRSVIPPGRAFVSSEIRSMPRVTECHVRA